MKIWRLQQGADKRVRGGHPWVFSNEISGSPKGLQPGEQVQLQDFKGGFLAHGYGNPHSLIAFRAVSFAQDQADCLSIESLVSHVVSCWGHRQMLGMKNSFRVVFGENDFLPGLVFDRYLLRDNKQVFVFQILTAGIQAAISDLQFFARRICEELMDSKLTEIDWENTAVVKRCDVNIRKLEGLEVLAPEVVKGLPDIDLSQSTVLISAGNEDSEPVLMNCDLFEGQKTGFFLDQSWNIELVSQLLTKNPNLESPVRILDLCCYVGQWSTRLTRALKRKGFEVEVELVDVSASALALAKVNAEREGAKVLVRELDVMENLSILPDHHYDLVIADPPAFIKAKKDLPTGRHAYLKFNSQAFRLCARGGLVVSCSCSGLFKEEDLKDVVRKAIQRHQLRARLIMKGGHACDHPLLAGFPEGEYLKMLVHQVSF